MSFKTKVSIELIVEHLALEDVLGEDYEFDAGKAFIEETLNESFPEDDPSNAHIASLEIIKVDDTTTGALARVGVG